MVKRAVTPEKRKFPECETSGVQSQTKHLYQTPFPLFPSQAV